MYKVLIIIFGLVLTISIFSAENSIEENFFLADLTPAQAIEIYHQYGEIVENSHDKIVITTPWLEDLSATSVTQISNLLEKRIREIQTSGPFAGSIFPKDISFVTQQRCLAYDTENEVSIVDINEDSDSFRYNVENNRYHSIYQFKKEYHSKIASDKSYDGSSSALASARLEQRNLKALAYAHANNKTYLSEQYFKTVAKNYKKDFRVQSDKYLKIIDSKKTNYDYHSFRIIPKIYCTKTTTIMRGEARLQILPEKVRELRGLEMTVMALRKIIQKIDQDLTSWSKMVNKLNTVYTLSIGDPNFEDPYGPYLPEYRKRIKGRRMILTGVADKSSYRELTGHWPTNFESKIYSCFEELVTNISKLKDEWSDVHPLAIKVVNAALARIESKLDREYFIGYRFGEYPEVYKIPVAFILPLSLSI